MQENYQDTASTPFNFLLLTPDMHSLSLSVKHGFELKSEFLSNIKTNTTQTLLHKVDIKTLHTLLGKLPVQIVKLIAIYFHKMFYFFTRWDVKAHMLINSNYFNMGPTTRRHSVIMGATICSSAITGSHISNGLHLIMYIYIANAQFTDRTRASCFHLH